MNRWKDIIFIFHSLNSKNILVNFIVKKFFFISLTNCFCFFNVSLCSLLKLHCWRWISCWQHWKKIQFSREERRRKIHIDGSFSSTSTYVSCLVSRNRNDIEQISILPFAPHRSIFLSNMPIIRHWCLHK
jgi:hypothetical protein